jgi:hypothetical protein
MRQEFSLEKFLQQGFSIRCTLSKQLLLSLVAESR